MDKGLLVLFKFGKEEHLEAFRQGHLHMRTRRYFADEERENLARGDRFEGASYLLQPKDVRMTFSNPLIGTIEIDPNDLAGPTFFSVNREAEQNIFCMFSITEPTKSLLHEEHLSFGTHFVLIRNTEEFFNRIRIAVTELGLRAEGRAVEYFDDTAYSGEVGPFRKSNRFAYQKEYRIVIQPGMVPFRSLEIGDISDITTPVLPLCDLDDIVNFSPEAYTETFNDSSAV
jgi:hypothetical protein